MDPKTSTNTTGQTSKINPFLKKNTATNNSNTLSNKVCQFFSNIPTPSFNNLYKPPNYQNSDLDSDQENKPQNITLNQSEARLKQVNLIKQKQSRKKTANSIANSEVPSKLAIKLSVNGNLCDVNQKQLTLLSDFSLTNTSNTKNSLNLANTRIEKIKAIKNHLSRLFLTIQSSNNTLLKKAKNKINPFKNYEIARLLQGLVFFKSNQKFEILSQVFNKHILGEQVKQIARHYNMDCLKAYYAIKQVYIQKKILSQYTNDFVVKIDKAMIIDTKTLVSLVGQFLNTDKKNLLMIYGSYLSSDKKPSKSGVCGVRQEINILWGNLHMMKNQSLQIQQMVFEIYKKYSQYQHVERYVMIELEAMRKRFESVNEKFSNKLVQMSIQRMLEEGRFNLSQCKGHYLDLVTFLINRQSINFQTAIQRLENVDLQQKWFEHFRAYIKDFSFDQQKQHQEIVRACYLYKLYKMFYSKNLFLERDLQEKLVKSVSTKCSIILGLKFIELIQSKILKVYILKLLLKYSQALLLQKEAEDGKLINRVLPLSNKPGSILTLIIDFIQQTFEDFIKSKDLQILQIQLSSGRKIIHSFFLSEAPLEIIMYYICIFYKFVSFSSKIQKNIEKIFKLLKEYKFENISPSVKYYNDKMITRLLDSKMIASQMQFIVEMTEDPLKKAEYIQQWLLHIQRLGLNEYFEQFMVVLNKLIQDVQRNTQVQIKLHTIQQFLNYFKNAILKFINQHSNPQNLNKKINLYASLIKASEWYNLISNEVPQSIHLFKLQLKSQIQSLIPRFYDRINLSGQNMSQKLAMIYQLITNDASYCINMDLSFSVLSDLVRKQKQFSIFQLYSLITQQLLKQQGIQPLVALYVITKLQPTLAKLLVNEIGVHLCSSLKQQSFPSLINIQKIIKLSINLFSYFSPKFKLQQKQKLKVLFRLIQDRVYFWLKNKKMTINLFQSLFDSLCLCKNSIPYEYHITYLINAKRQKMLSSFTTQQYKRVSLHLLYILSLKISKKSCLVDVSNEQQLQQLQEQLQVFSQLQLTLLNHFAKECNAQSFDQYSQRYMNKLNKVLFQCANQPLLSQVVVGLLRKINQTLSHITSKSYSNIFFRKQKTLVQKYLQSSSNLQRGAGSLYKPFQFLRCTNSKDFNQILEKNLNKLTLNPENELGELQMVKMISFIENNCELFLDYVYISSKHIKSKQIDLIFLQLINKILSKLNPNHYAKKQNKNAIKDIIIQVISSLNLFDYLQALRLNRQIIYTVNSILQNSLLSPFQVSSICSPTITQILHLLRQILFKWTPCNIPSLHYLDQISLILNHYPTGTNYNKNFTLWNLVQYREKLYLINQILQYALQVNGLIDIKKHGLIQIIVEFTTFLVLNQSHFQTKQTQQKIAGINKMLQPLPMSPNNLNNFISNNLSIPQLKQSAWHIVQQLNYLNFQYTSFQAKFFEHFNPNNGE